MARAAAHPVARAVRPDKLALAGLAATLAGWKTGSWRRFPIYRAAGAPLRELEERGGRILAGLSAPGSELHASVERSEAAFGGGTSPEKLFESRALSVTDRTTPADTLAESLRRQSPPVIGRVERGRVILDLRSIQPEEDPIVARALHAMSMR